MAACLVDALLAGLLAVAFFAAGGVADTAAVLTAPASVAVAAALSAGAFSRVAGLRAGFALVEVTVQSLSSLSVEIGWSAFSAALGEMGSLAGKD